METRISFDPTFLAGGIDWTRRRERRRRRGETFKSPSCSPETTWRPACMTWSWRTRQPPPSANSRSVWRGRGDPVMRNLPPPSCQADTAPCTVCAKDYQVTAEERRTMRTMRAAKSVAARWGPFFCGGSCGSRQTLARAPLWALRAASRRRGAGASVQRPASAWWYLTSPTPPVTAATLLQTTVQVNLAGPLFLLSVSEE